MIQEIIQIASSVKVGLSPEGFDVSPDGKYAIAVNMRRTYAPSGFWFVPGTNKASLSLVSINPASGELSVLGGQYGFKGALPEDAIFDKDSNSVAVAVYHDKDEEMPEQGWIDFWEIQKDQLVRTKTKLYVTSVAFIIYSYFRNMQPIRIESITQLLQFAGIDDLRHPLFHIIRVEDINQLPSQFPLEFSFGFYSIGLIRNMKGDITCGRQPYDFQKGTMFFVSPKQLIGHTLEALADADGWLLLFHRAYLAAHPLEKKILQYGYFDYSVTESLHLSKQEENSMEQIFQNLYKEFCLPIDHNSQSVVHANIELLLTYANRYYSRQFITRNHAENNFVMEFEGLLNEYMHSQNSAGNGLPQVDYFADQLHMSAKYLGDKLRVLTGKTAQEHIHMKVVENAQVLLRQKRHTVAQVAYQLGFEYPEYFSRFFKKRVGVSPKEFQLMKA